MRESDAQNTHLCLRGHPKLTTDTTGGGGNARSPRPSTRHIFFFGSSSSITPAQWEVSSSSRRRNPATDSLLSLFQHIKMRTFPAALLAALLTTATAFAPTTGLFGVPQQCSSTIGSRLHSAVAEAPTAELTAGATIENIR